MQSDTNCSLRSDSLLNRVKTGNFTILGRDRDERTPKSAGSTRAFLANSLRNRTGNFKRRTGNSFGRSGNFQGRAGNLSARTPCNRWRDSSSPKLRQSCGHRKEQISSSSPQRRAMYSTRLWMCAAMIYPAGPGAYDNGEFCRTATSAPKSSQS